MKKLERILSEEERIRKKNHYDNMRIAGGLTFFSAFVASGGPMYNPGFFVEHFGISGITTYIITCAGISFGGLGAMIKGEHTGGKYALSLLEQFSRRFEESAQKDIGPYKEKIFCPSLIPPRIRLNFKDYMDRKYKRYWKKHGPEIMAKRYAEFVKK